jgi:uncharacterized RDD family membrane protein YckC
MKYKERYELQRNEDLKLARMWKRAAAIGIDGLILFAILLGLLLLINLLGVKISNVNIRGASEVEIDMESNSAGAHNSFKFLFGMIPVIYFTLSYYFWKGRSIGKWILGIRVISLYHERMGWWHCLERSLGYFASALEFGLGFIQAFWNPNRMTLHDKIGETIVIEN